MRTAAVFCVVIVSIFPRHPLPAEVHARVRGEKSVFLRVPTHRPCPASRPTDSAPHVSVERQVRTALVDAKADQKQGYDADGAAKVAE